MHMRLLWILCYLCLVFFMLSDEARLFIAALWSPAGKGLTSWLLFVMFICVFVTFPCGILGQVWYLIASIPDFCRLSYFDTYHCRATKVQTSQRKCADSFENSMLAYTRYGCR